ncbi:HET-domain-containing protein [Cubamyces sp. BRFM 1775]|nr:HET-domain-containing protein [Cubamyces sp. BRFM 1775]
MELPPVPDSICETAWEGVFAAHFGLLHEPISESVRWREGFGCYSYYTGGYGYSLPWDEWLDCAYSGCLWCQLLRKNFREKLIGRTDEVHIRVGRRCSWVQVISIILNGHEVRFRVHTPEDDPAASWIQDRSRMPHAAAPHILPMAKICVEECIRSHDKCQAITPHPIGSAPLPTRLIDCSDPDCLRLIETDGNMRGSYIALSYVWGPKADQEHRTTGANVQSYMRSIDSAVLPQTIMDAVQVTRALGVRFLWIDSLCIVQDSMKDMNRELARMQDVYRHAYLTIDVGSAASVTDGFLRDRRPLDPDNWLPFICPSRRDGSPVHEPTHAPIGHVYWDAAVKDFAGLWTSDFTISDTGSFLSFQPTSHTVGRGWCLQERLLSTRSLIFTFETVQLRCHTLTRNVEGARHEDKYDLPRLPEATFHPDREVVPGCDEWKRISMVWRDIVCDYSRRSLSNPSDKLIALSGLAGMFAPVLGPDYLAGLWRDTLLQDLLWESDSRGIAHPHHYRAPSWSWASHDGQIDCYMRDKIRIDRMVSLAEVVECTTTVQDETLPFGHVVDGTLSLSTNSLRCHWAGTNEFGRQQIEIDQHYLALLELEPDDRLVGDVSLDYDEDRALREMWFIPLIQDVDGNYLVGFVATRARLLDGQSSRDSETSSQGDVYRRVGFCSVKVYGLSVGSTTILDMLQELPTVVIELV